MTRAPYRPGRPLDGLTRRNFLLASGVTGAAALIAGAAGVSLSHVLERAAADPLPNGTPILVVLTMYGGNDGLNTVVPYTDPAYRAARGSLAWGEGEVLKLDGAFGLNPGMTQLADVYRNKKLAIVQGVGYPKPDRSHFRSMDIWQSASPDSPETSGWIGRWLDSTDADPLSALSIGPILPPLAVGRRRTAAALIDGGGAGVDRAVAALAPLSSIDPSDTQPARDLVASYVAAATLQQTVLGPLSQAQDGEPAGADGEAVSGGALGRQLNLVASCIKAGAPSRVYLVSTGGFDTHASEKDDHKGLLAGVDAALGGFLKSLAGSPRAADVVVMAYSEFGRRVQANASDGTDHGSAGPMFLLGDRVVGGLHGQLPSLTDLDAGDLRYGVDFRSVYGAVLANVLRADPGPVLPGAPTPLAVIRS